MSGALVIFGLSLLLGLLMVRLWIPLAHRFGLVAAPGAHRRHLGETALTGGLGMVTAGGIVTLVLNIPVDTGLALGILLLLLVGVLDDRFSLPYLVRFAFQIVAMLLLLWMDEVRLTDLGRVFSVELAGLGGWSGFLTVLAGVGVINSVNMVDGMDGLAGSLAMTCLVGGALLITVSPSFSPDLLLVIVGVLAGFLLLNLRLPGRPRARVFMGDAGSMVLGLVLTWMLIRHSQGQGQAFPPVVALWLLALPLYDAVGVLLRRPLRGGSPFEADWRHTHHLLLRLGLGYRTTLSILICLSLCLAAYGALLARLGVAEHVLFYTFLGLFVFYLLLMEAGERLANSRTGAADGC
jgi:UDP-GlcNAc:undecaprenyl-phosphate GlcNAc-1-phosphate transferase